MPRREASTKPMYSARGARQGLLLASLAAMAFAAWTAGYAAAASDETEMELVELNAPHACCHITSIAARPQSTVSDAR